MKGFTLGLAMLCLPLAAAASPDTYEFDPYHTYVHFAVDHLGMSTMWGRFDKVSGRFTLDAQNKKGSVELAVETGSISTGDNERGSRARSRDEHLRNADFFNVTEFPRMTYKSTEVKFNGDALATIEGQLTLLGVTRPLTLTVDRWKCGAHPFRKTAMCGGNAQGVLRRSEFGMKYGLPGVGDEVRLFVGVEGYKQ